MKIGNLTGGKAVAALAAAAIVIAAASSGITYLATRDYYENSAQEYERKLDATVDAYERIFGSLGGSLESGDDARAVLEELADPDRVDDVSIDETPPKLDEGPLPDYFNSEQPDTSDPVTLSETDDVPGEVALPNLAGLPLAGAVELLNALNCPANIVETYDASVPEGVLLTDSPAEALTTTV